MRLPLFRQVVALRTYRLTSGGGHRARTWVFEARRGAKTLIGVVLHSSRSSLGGAFTGAAKVLNWGFAR